MSNRAIEEVRRLVAKFAQDEAHYIDRSSGYKESDTRSEFIDPLLNALGWDATNAAGVTPTLKDVVREESQEQEDDATKYPDYTLRVSGHRRMYVEAKKPSLDITGHLDSALQTRRYGYTAQHPISVLTNFRDLIVYDTSFSPRESDFPATGRLFRWNYTDYADKFDEIHAVLSRASVGGETWHEQFEQASPRQPIPADEEFINHYNRWRLELGNDLLAQDNLISEVDLNDAVQRVLNRLIFVRMCEDRGIEGERSLRTAVEGGGTEVSKLLQRLDRRYNTGLFETPSGDASRKVGEDAIRSIVDELYSPRSPFSFAVLDATFFGLVYEATLVEHLVIAQHSAQVKRVELKKKREYEHREVVTTPQALVDRTVEEAMSALDSSKLDPLTLDFAVGSGRFLLAVYDRLIEKATASQAPQSNKLITVGPGEYRLKFEEKRRLLVENLFGIDIDFNAVEVAKFSLVLRLLQDETKHTIPRSAATSILPDLDNNIFCGNTLVRSLDGVTPEQEIRTNPLDLRATSLPEVADLIVGNPPYMKTQDMKKFDAVELAYLKTHYSTTFQQFDKYFAFVEFAANFLAEKGVMGVVIPSKWMTVVAGRELRKLLRTSVAIHRLDNFREAQVFPDKSIYVCSLIARKSAPASFTYSEPADIDEYASRTSPAFRVSRQMLPKNLEGAWVLPVSKSEKKILNAIRKNSILLEDVVEERNGVQTSKNDVYVIKSPQIVSTHVEWTDRSGKRWQVESAVTRPYLDDSRTIRSHHEVVADSVILFPYAQINPADPASGWVVIPETTMRRKYPLAYKYFVHHKNELDRRDVSDGERKKAFYVFGRSQAISYATFSPKIFYTNNQRGDKYGLDKSGVVFASGGTGGEVCLFSKNPHYSLDFVLGLLDQAPIEFFLRKRGSVFRGGYYARGTDVIGDVPVPKLDFTSITDQQFHNDVVSEVARLRALHMKSSRISPRNKRRHLQAISSSRAALAEHFRKWWGLTKSDIRGLSL